MSFRWFKERRRADKGDGWLIETKFGPGPSLTFGPPVRWRQLAADLLANDPVSHKARLCDSFVDQTELTAKTSSVDLIGLRWRHLSTLARPRRWYLLYSEPFLLRLICLVDKVNII